MSGKKKNPVIVFCQLGVVRAIQSREKKRGHILFLLSLVSSSKSDRTVRAIIRWRLDELM